MDMEILGLDLIKSWDRVVFFVLEGDERINKSLCCLIGVLFIYLMFCICLWMWLIIVLSFNLIFVSFIWVDLEYKVFVLWLNFCIRKLSLCFMGFFCLRSVVVLIKCVVNWFSFLFILVLVVSKVIFWVKCFFGRVGDILISFFICNFKWFWIRFFCWLVCVVVVFDSWEILLNEEWRVFLIFCFLFWCVFISDWRVLLNLVFIVFKWFWVLFLFLDCLFVFRIFCRVSSFVVFGGVVLSCVERFLIKLVICLRILWFI